MSHVLAFTFGVIIGAYTFFILSRPRDMDKTSTGECKIHEWTYDYGRDDMICIKCNKTPSDLLEEHNLSHKDDVY